MEHFICIEVKYKGKAPKYIGEFNSRVYNIYSKDCIVVDLALLALKEKRKPELVCRGHNKLGNSHKELNAIKWLGLNKDKNGEFTEYFRIDLTKLPSDVVKSEIVFSIWNAKNKHQSLNDIEYIGLKIGDKESNIPLDELTCKDDIRLLVLGEFDFGAKSFNSDITGYDISFSVDYKNLYRK